MERIDLTLRKEFTKGNSNRNHFDDTVAYNRKMDYRDQRRSFSDILGSAVKGFFPFVLSVDFQWKEFFKEDHGYYKRQYENDESVERITGILTKDLAMEYVCGYGLTDTCDRCGGFKSRILNCFNHSLCDKCEKEYKFRNDNFWNREQLRLQEVWID